MVGVQATSPGELGEQETKKQVSPIYKKAAATTTALTLHSIIISMYKKNKNKNKQLS